MSATNGQDLGHALTIAEEAIEQTRLLRSLLAEVRSDVLDVAVSDGPHRELVLDSFPVAGAKRVVAFRTTQGSDGVGITGTATLLIPADAARLGGRVVNVGTNPAFLYLTGETPYATGRAGQANSASVWLAGNGGSWDFRLSSLLWCGSVFALSSLGTTLVWGTV